jgi:hypothetical protein
MSAFPKPEAGGRNSGEGYVLSVPIHGVAANGFYQPEAVFASPEGENFSASL